MTGTLAVRVSTHDIKSAIAGRETVVLDALGGRLVAARGRTHEERAKRDRDSEPRRPVFAHDGVLPSFPKKNLMERHEERRGSLVLSSGIIDPIGRPSEVSG